MISFIDLSVRVLTDKPQDHDRHTLFSLSALAAPKLKGALPLLLCALQHVLSMREQQDWLIFCLLHITGKEAHELHGTDFSLDGVPILVGPHSVGALKRLDNLERLLRAEAENADAQSAASASKSNAAAKLVSCGHTQMHHSPASPLPASLHLMHLAPWVTLSNDALCLRASQSAQLFSSNLPAWW